MQLDKDGKGHNYAEVENIRITYIPANDREAGANWSGSDVIRVQAYRGGDDKSLHMGAELPVPNSEVFSQFIAAFCRIYVESR